MRTAEPAVAHCTVQKAAALLRNTWNGILGCAACDIHWGLATLPVRLGGLGINDPGDYLAAASISSWVSALAFPGFRLSSLPKGGHVFVADLARTAPALGGPLQAIWASGDPLHVKNHVLFARWKEQSAWGDEIQKKKRPQK